MGKVPPRGDNARRPRCLVVTADMGAGHTTVAAELARRLTACGMDVEVVDVLQAAGAAGARLRGTYRWLLAHAPWLYDAAMRVWLRVPRPLEWFTAASAGRFDRALDAAVTRVCPDVVVSTYNLAAQALGRLAARGRIGVPLVTYVTDPGAHPYWVSPAVDVHLAISGETAAALRRFGARRVEVVEPVVRPEFRSPPGRAAARAELDLPADRRICLVNGGAWGAGRLEATVRSLLADPANLPVVLCGRDSVLLARLGDLPEVLAVPWTDRVPAYLAAADLVVDNAGGQTCLEAMACGTPVVMHRPLPGHGRLNAEALEAAGAARFARDPSDLVEAIGNLVPIPVRPPAADPADVIVGLARVATEDCSP